MSEIDDRESIKRSARKVWTNLYFCCKIKEAKARGFYMSNKNFYQSDQVLKNYETDFKQEVKPSAILGFFQEAASENSEEAGFGYSSLAPLGMLWVLSKIYVEVDRLPKLGEKIVVQTWPHAPNKAIFERSFLIRDEGGEAVIRAFSRWCVLRANGRIVPASQVPRDLEDYISEKSIEFDDWAVPQAADCGEAAFSLKIANSEYDRNMHVNNIKYADYIFNCFSVEELKAKKLKSFQIHYVQQSHEGDVLRFYRKQLSENEYAVEGVKNGTETVIAARVCFDGTV